MSAENGCRKFNPSEPVITTGLISSRRKQTPIIMQENRISIQIKQEDLAAVQTAITSIQTVLAPYLIALTPDDRRNLPKMSDNSLPFVQKAIEYAQINTQLIPAFVNLPELQKDYSAVNDLLTMLRPIQQVSSNLEDTIMLCGSEAFVAALAFYNSAKTAAKMKVPGAEPIVEDMGQRFVKTTGKKVSEVKTS